MMADSVAEGVESEIVLLIDVNSIPKGSVGARRSDHPNCPKGSNPESMDGLEFTLERASGSYESVNSNKWNLPFTVRHSTSPSTKRIVNSLRSIAS